MTPNLRNASHVIAASARSYGVRGPGTTGNYTTCCPFCAVITGRPDVKFKLSFHPGKGVYHCYRCETAGRASFDWLGGVAKEGPSTEYRPTPSISKPDGFVRITDSGVMVRPYRAYLEGRGMLGAAQNVGAGACLSGRYAGRVVIPMLDDQGDWIGFTARAVFPGMTPKYLMPPGMDRKHLLWGKAHLRPNDTEPVVLVEGVFDALPLYPVGVASFGKAVTDEQIDVLLSLNRPIVICLDGDAWEESRALAARFWLRGREDTRWCKLPPGEDPGTLGHRVWEFIQPALIDQMKLLQPVHKSTQPEDEEDQNEQL